jgi:hypothetical protein
LIVGSIARQRWERSVAAAIAGAVVLFIAFHVFDCGNIRPSHAAAQETDDPTVLVLAMAMVAEGNWDADKDHAAIAHTLARKATRHGLPLVDVLVRYVSILRVDATGEFVVDSDRARWVRELNLDATKPDHWPSHLSWSAHVDRWLAVVERARSFLRGELPDPCGAEHWGGVRAGDMPRGRMVIAACSGLTNNTFYRLAARK